MKYKVSHTPVSCVFRSGKEYGTISAYIQELPLLRSLFVSDIDMSEWGEGLVNPLAVKPQLGGGRVG